MKKKALCGFAAWREHKARIVLLLLGLSYAPARAERIYFFSGEVNVVNSMDDNPQVDGLSLGRAGTSGDFRYTFGLFPTLRLHSQGPESQFEIFYSFGLNRIDSELDLDSESNAFGGDFQGNISPHLSFHFTESFRRSPDFTTQNLFRGIVFTPEGAFFDFETVSQRATSTENTANIDFEYELGPQSQLEFGFGHSLRELSENPAFQNRLSDQNRFQGNFGFSRSLSDRTAWDVKYRIQHLDFSDFEDRRTHEVTFGATRDLTPSTRFEVRAGPSYTESSDTQPDFLGGVGSASLTYSFDVTRISLSFSRRNAASTGVGSASKTDQISFNFSRPLARKLVLDLGVGLFDSDRLGDNPTSQRGINGSAILSILLSDNWRLGLGASYRSQDSEEDTAFDLTRRQFFVSLNFLLPEFWRFKR